MKMQTLIQTLNKCATDHDNLHRKIAHAMSLPMVCTLVEACNCKARDSVSLSCGAQARLNHNLLWAPFRGSSLGSTCSHSRLTKFPRGQTNIEAATSRFCSPLPSQASLPVRSDCPVIDQFVLVAVDIMSFALHSLDIRVRKRHHDSAPSPFTSPSCFTLAQFTSASVFSSLEWCYPHPQMGHSHSSFSVRPQVSSHSKMQEENNSHPPPPSPFCKGTKRDTSSRCPPSCSASPHCATRTFTISSVLELISTATLQTHRLGQVSFTNESSCCRASCGEEL